MNHLFRLRKIYKKLALWFLILNFTFQPVLAAAAEVTPDPAHGKNPTLIQAGNGVNLVNILAPDEKGLSHNQYINFQVGPQGIVFNNQTGISKTQLAGYIAGNPNFLNRNASVILNEVTGRLPTQINGYMEVAGQRADVIIANPNGIVGNNFGFINTSRGVLTTGVPMMKADGSLDKFHVQGGAVSFEGTGFNGNGTDRVDIIAQAVKVNAGIWAKDLHITTGSNDVTYTDQITRLEPKSMPTGGVALDVSALGGMYANKITMIGTEKGMGINSLGNISAGDDSLRLTQAGKVILAGKTFSEGNIHIDSQDSLVQNGVSYATGTMNVNAAAIQNTGTIAAAQDLNLTATNIASTGTLGAGIQADGTVGTAGNLNLTAQNQLAANGSNLAAGDLTLQAGSVNLQGASTYIGKQGTIMAVAGDIDHTNGTMRSKRSLDFLANNFSNQGGHINADDSLNLKLAGTLNNDKGVLYTGSTLTANAGAIINTGTIAAARDLNLTAANIASTGTLGAGIQADGSVGTAGNLNLIVQNKIAANGSNLAAGDFTMQAGSVDLQGASTSIGKQGIITAVTGDLDNTNGVIQSKSTLSLAGNNLINQGGNIKSADNIDVKLSGALTNDKGLFYAGGNLAANAGTVTNTGTIAAARDMNLTAQDIASTGTLGAGIQADGTTGTVGGLKLNANHQLTATGSNLAGENLTMQAGT